VFSAATTALRTVFKAGIKSGMIAYDKSKEMVGDTKTSIADIAREARSEADAETKSQKGQSGRGAPKTRSAKGKTSR
jgi:hypothetical protein